MPGVWLNQKAQQIVLRVGGRSSSESPDIHCALVVGCPGGVNPVAKVVASSDKALSQRWH